MSLRSTCYYGRLGHIFHDGYDQVYRWQPPGVRTLLGYRLPFRRPWRWLAMRRCGA